MHTAAYLALAQTHVDEGERHIADQECLISRLAAGRHNTAAAEELLRVMREILAVMRDHRDQIATEIRSSGAPKISK